MLESCEATTFHPHILFLVMSMDSEISNEIGPSLVSTLAQVVNVMERVEDKDKGKSCFPPFISTQPFISKLLRYKFQAQKSRNKWFLRHVFVSP